MDHENVGKLVEGVWLPKDEKHLTEWMQHSKGAHRIDGVITYQWAKQDAAMKLAESYVPHWRNRTFVDIGAHVGLWSMWWGKVMSYCLAFEPIPDMRTLYRANMKDRAIYGLEAYALSDEAGTMLLNFNPENTGNTHSQHTGDKTPPIKVEMISLDNYLSALTGHPSLQHNIGVMKIDTEGTEERVVAGAEKTIKKHKPLMVVEQKKGAEYYGNDPRGAIDLLESWGFKTMKVMSGDYMLLHEDLLS